MDGRMGSEYTNAASRQASPLILAISRSNIMAINRLLQRTEVIIPLDNIVKVIKSEQNIKQIFSILLASQRVRCSEILIAIANADLTDSQCLALSDLLVAEIKSSVDHWQPYAEEAWLENAIDQVVNQEQWSALKRFMKYADNETLSESYCAQLINKIQNKQRMGSVINKLEALYPAIKPKESLSILISKTTPDPLLVRPSSESCFITTGVSGFSFLRNQGDENKARELCREARQRHKELRSTITSPLPLENSVLDNKSMPEAITWLNGLLNSDDTRLLEVENEGVAHCFLMPETLYQRMMGKKGVPNDYFTGERITFRKSGHNNGLGTLNISLPKIVVHIEQKTISLERNDKVNPKLIEYVKQKQGGEGADRPLVIQIAPDQGSGCALYLVVGYQKGGFHERVVKLPDKLEFQLLSTDEHMQNVKALTPEPDASDLSSDAMPGVDSYFRALFS
jgi:hypothetical protein